MHLNHFISKALDSSKNFVQSPAFTNDIIVVKCRNSDTDGYTFGCSPVDVRFEQSSKVFSWDEETVEVAATDNREYKFRLTLHELISANPVAFHLSREVSERLERLQLNDGKNDVTFTLLLDGEDNAPQVKARMFLWNSTAETRIVVTDLDGTIIKSDFWGAINTIFPMIKTPTHTGAKKLFSEIESKGYKIIYLSGRPRSVLDQTRKYLFEEEKFPDGPLIISSHGLIECGRREFFGEQDLFKGFHLKAIRKLFPKAGPNPFHAGFGNRGSDRKCYRQISIPEEKMFHINSKGESVKRIKNEKVSTSTLGQLEGYALTEFPTIRGESSKSSEEGSPNHQKNFCRGESSKSIEEAFSSHQKD